MSKRERERALDTLIGQDDGTRFYRYPEDAQAQSMADSAVLAEVEPATEITWECEPDIGEDADEVAITVELLASLVAKAREYDSLCTDCVATCASLHQ